LPRNQLQAGAVAFGEQPLLAVTDREQQFLGFVEPQGTGRYVKGLAHLADGHGFLCHHRHSYGLVQP
jgi:hypothetical protein